MLQLLTIVLAIVFSLSNEPPQTALGDLQTSAVTAPGDQQTPPAPAPAPGDQDTPGRP